MEIDDYIIASDYDLVNWALNADDVAFTHLVGRYKDSIHSLFVQRLDGVNDADDLLQETFIKVFMNLDKYNPTYTFGQWVYTIARNTFIDFMRKRQDDVSIDDKLNIQISDNPTPEESVINLQKRTQIEGCMELLTPQYKQLIKMRFFDEYSYEEISEKLSLPMGTVKTQIHRARGCMCRLIDKDR